MKKILSMLFVLLLIAGALAACSDRAPQPPASENGAQNYTRLTQWDYHPSYGFILASVEEQGDTLLLRGVIARDTLTPEEVEAARAEGTIEINGIKFIHSAIDIEGFMPTDSLYNTSTGADMFLIPAYFGDFEGDDMRYRMVEADGQTHFFKRTGMYREVEVDKTTPVEIWRLVVELREWGYLEMFAPLETSARVFLDYSEYDLPDSFPFGGTLFPIFENGRCIHLRWSRF